MTEQFRKPATQKRTKKLTKKQQKKIIQSYRAVSKIVKRAEMYSNYERSSADTLLQTADW